MAKHKKSKQKSFLDKFTKDGYGRWALWQWPNFWLMLWALTHILWLLTHGDVQRLAGAASFGAIFVWAFLELADGANYFRRLLGAVVLVLVIWGRFN